ncbi:hypothetical protein Hypma_009419 [Hypsizygus marmoreus]|uniref:Uncharacterized protein n=1 Tax=Hypsizygus marmoreus TaxID=39966 RepID=A0A369JVG9_HYPMA|nr:hypothetical protein Hypma_009419 [Hypsizygus marmoreus]
MEWSQSCSKFRHVSILTMRIYFGHGCLRLITGLPYAFLTRELVHSDEQSLFSSGRPRTGESRKAMCSESHYSGAWGRKAKPLGGLDMPSTRIYELFLFQTLVIVFLSG